jgi:hypothetical protein
MFDLLLVARRRRRRWVEPGASIPPASRSPLLTRQSNLHCFWEYDKWRWELSTPLTPGRHWAAHSRTCLTHSCYLCLPPRGAFLVARLRSLQFTTCFRFPHWYYVHIVAKKKPTPVKRRYENCSTLSVHKLASCLVSCLKGQCLISKVYANPSRVGQETSHSRARYPEINFYT